MRFFDETQLCGGGFIIGAIAVRAPRRLWEQPPALIEADRVTLDSGAFGELSDEKLFAPAALLLYRAATRFQRLTGLLADQLVALLGTAAVRRFFPGQTTYESRRFRGKGGGGEDDGNGSSEWNFLFLRLTLNLGLRCQVKPEILGT